MGNQIISGLKARKDVESIIPRISYDGCPPSPEDSALYAELLVLRIALIVDLFDDECSAIAYRRALLSLKIIDAKVVCNCAKDFYSALTQEEFLKTGDWQIFKQSVAALPQWFVAPPLRYLEGNVDKPIEETFSKFLQWAKFDAKLNFRSTPSRDEAIAYLDDEFTMKREPIDFDLLDQLRQILIEWLDDFPTEDTPFCGIHSSGSVTGVKRRDATPEAKSKVMRHTTDTRKYCDFRSYDSNPMRAILDFPETELIAPLASDKEQAIDVIFVPKNPLTRRVVSPEDAMHMFLQADAASMITPWINSFHWCDLGSQQTSRDMCMRGSETGEYVTIDCSKASDFVRVSHAEYVFRGTVLYPLIMLTRSKFARVRIPPIPGEGRKDLTIIELEKLAPMGSKTCFLMEELFFALCCELAVRLVAGRKSKKGDFFVYGDDVVSRAVFYNCLRFILALMRYRVNDTKTFTGQGRLKFREACGVFAVNGKNVTPWQVSRRYQGIDALLASMTKTKTVPYDVPEATQMMGVSDSLNRLTIHNLKLVRRWCYILIGNQEFMQHIRRVSLSDYLRDEERWQINAPTIGDYSAPYLITWDHVDTNFQLHRKMKKWKGQSTWCYVDDRLIIVARPDGRREARRDDDLAYFHNTNVRQFRNLGYQDPEWRWWESIRFETDTSYHYCSRPRLVWRTMRR